MSKEEVEVALKEAMAKLAPPAAPLKPGVKSSEFLLLAAYFAASLLNKKLGLAVDPSTLNDLFMAVLSFLGARFGLKALAFLKK
jgi:hypothetical protein